MALAQRRLSETVSTRPAGGDPSTEAASAGTDPVAKTRDLVAKLKAHVEEEQRYNQEMEARIVAAEETLRADKAQRKEAMQKAHAKLQESINGLSDRIRSTMVSETSMFEKRTDVVCMAYDRLEELLPTIEACVVPVESANRQVSGRAHSQEIKKLWPRGGSPTRVFAGPASGVLHSPTTSAAASGAVSPSRHSRSDQQDPESVVAHVLQKLMEENEQLIQKGKRLMQMKVEFQRSREVRTHGAATTYQMSRDSRSPIGRTFHRGSVSR